LGEPQVVPGDEWPEAPIEAKYHRDEGPWGWQGHGWTVPDPPPPPFPFVDPPYPRAVYGPPGTVWLFSVSELLAGQVHLPGWAGTAAFNAAIKKLGLRVGGGAIQGWRTPDPEGNERGPTHMMRWIRTQVVAKVGQDEEVVHVLNWRHSTQENAPADAIAVKTLALAVRNSWFDWWTTNGGSVFFPPQLQYTEVRGSLMEQANPGEKPTWPLPTQVVPFNGPPCIGTATEKALPYEVACCLGLNTNWRGTSRFRGRIYLGPLTSNLLGSEGQFTDAIIGLGQSFGLHFIDSVAQASDYELHVVSQKYGTSAAIQGVRVGHTPDSQRRRRRDRVENYVQAWGQPVGAN
jgi:hypothetical protein